MEQHISTKQVCLLLGISLSTFYRYCKAGLLNTTFLTFGKHRRFSLSQLRQSFNLDNDAVLSLCYSRVSSHEQKNDLISQENKLLNFAKNNNYLNILSITDLGSGLNYKKKGFLKLVQMIFNHEFEILVINHRDRLLRFGVDLMEIICIHHGVRLIVLEDKKKSFEEQLTQDVIELMTVFCAKLYGKRSHNNKRKVIV